jgi:hypothetical protein
MVEIGSPAIIARLPTTLDVEVDLISMSIARFKRWSKILSSMWYTAATRIVTLYSWTANSRRNPQSQALRDLQGSGVYGRVSHRHGPCTRYSKVAW